MVVGDMLVLYPVTLKSAGYFVIPFIQKFALSVRHHLISSLYLEHFLTDFLHTLYKG